MNGDSSIDINKFGTYVEGENDISQSWYVILHTIPGSDPLRPNFGSDIYKYLDKPNNSFNGKFSAQIIRDLERWEKRCAILEAKPIVGDDNNIKVFIRGIYKATNTIVKATLTINELSTAEITEKMRNYGQDYNEKQYN